MSRLAECKVFICFVAFGFRGIRMNARPRKNDEHSALGLQPNKHCRSSFSGFLFSHPEMCGT